MILCDHCGKTIDRTKIDLGQQVEFAPGVDLHPECQEQFKADLQEFVKSKKGASRARS